MWASSGAVTPETGTVHMPYESGYVHGTIAFFTGFGTGLPGTHSLLVGGTALGASGRSNNGLKLDVKTGK